MRACMYSPAFFAYSLALREGRRFSHKTRHKEGVWHGRRSMMKMTEMTFRTQEVKLLVIRLRYPHELTLILILRNGKRSF
jgi:hypothetical protein